jgi:hypothetical protein
MMKVPITSCVRRLPMKLRMSRGPNWLAARVRTTMVMERTRLAIVTIEVRTVARSSRAWAGSLT